MFKKILYSLVFMALLIGFTASAFAADLWYESPWYDGVSIAPMASGKQHQTYQLQLVKFVNKTGSSIAVGKLLVPDITAGQGITTVIAATAFDDSTAISITNDLSSEAGFHRLIFTNSTAVFDAGTIYIVGYDENGNYQTESVTVTADAGGEYVSAYTYTDVTSITPYDIDDTNDTAKLTVTAKAVNAMCLPATADPDLTTVVGVCYGAVGGFNVTSVADEGTGYMAISGTLAQVYVTPADQNGGAVLGTCTTTIGYLGATSTAAHGGIVARLIDQNKAETEAARRLWVVMYGGQ